ncbi:hypothetical protein L7F22_030993 [Adiantum nelumboides]|nr:hypothetical protein [Adiantum nelumboides]
MGALGPPYEILSAQSFFDGRIAVCGLVLCPPSDHSPEVITVVSKLQVLFCLRTPKLDPISMNDGHEDPINKRHPERTHAQYMVHPLKDLAAKQDEDPSSDKIDLVDLQAH